MNSSRIRFPGSAALAASLALGLWSCAENLATQSGEPGIKDAAKADQEHTDYASIIRRLEAVESSIPYLACGPALRALIHDARQLCNEKAAASAQESSSQSAPKASGTCNEKDMKVALATAERDLETKSIGQKLLALLRHEVAYPTLAGQIAHKRELRLRALAQERLLPSTTFLIVAGGTDAAQRIETIAARLHAYGVTDSEQVTDGEKQHTVQHFEKPWILKLNVPLVQLPLVDRPVPPAEPRDLERAVFVFRTDCP